MTIPLHRDRGYGQERAQGRVRPPDLGYRSNMTSPGERAPLPETADLLRHLAQGSCVEDIGEIATTAPDRVAACRALPEMNLPFLRFRIDAADPGLIAFAGQPTPGFEVLEALGAGFQYSSRRDLVRACEEQLPLLGHLCGPSETSELVVDHMSGPVIRRARARKVRGWLIFRKDLPQDGATDLPQDICVLGRAATSRSVRLPGGLPRPRVEAARTQEIPTRTGRPPKKRRMPMTNVTVIAAPAKPLTGRHQPGPETMSVLASPKSEGGPSRSDLPTLSPARLSVRTLGPRLPRVSSSA